ncbi:hypothetical protein H0H87_001539 [Tephrocybe sp. NHM501043]|nr:hypothetical protein H0H87_001539 [Tephrocybe sp. NHM501043]
MSGTSTLQPERNYGIPPRTPASTSLWAHLLRKDTQRPPSSAGPVLPPIAPLDKNGTSMRILLHDTQAHLDKFSASADKLLAGVNEATCQISTVNTLFQREHEALTEDLVDLVNRSQTQLQTTIGAPAQVERLETLSKDLTMHFEATEKRLDAIQSLNQTHSQVLQLQSQAIQSLQEQHGTVLAALLPLLPLIQAIPLHIDVARNRIAELLFPPTKLTSSRSNPSKDDRGRPVTKQTSQRNKRSSSTFRASSSPSPLRKKARSSVVDPSSKIPNAVTPVAVTHNSRKEFGSSLRGIIQPVSDTSSLTRCETTIVPSPPPETSNRPSRTFLTAVSPSVERPHPYPMRTVLAPSKITLLEPNADSSSPPILTNPKLNLRSSLLFDSSVRTVTPCLATPDIHKHTKPTRQTPVPFLDPSLHYKIQTSNAFDSTGPLNKANQPSIGIPLPQQPLIATPSDTTSRPPLWRTGFTSKGIQITRPPLPTFPQLDLSREKPTFLSRGLSGTPQQRFPPAKVRERRSPLAHSDQFLMRPTQKEGRRFIPLDDSDDDEGASDE